MDLIQSYKEELQLIRKPWTRVWVGAFVLFLVLLPWVAPQYITYIVTREVKSGRPDLARLATKTPR